MLNSAFSENLRAKFCRGFFGNSVTFPLKNSNFKVMLVEENKLLKARNGGEG